MIIKILLVFLSLAIYSNAKSQTICQITKIKRTGKFYVIYATSDDTMYKIVSKKERVKNCNRLKKNEHHSLELTIVSGMGGSDIDCFSFDEKTVICKEPGIRLVSANNLKGLCIARPASDE